MKLVCVSRHKNGGEKSERNFRESIPKVAVGKPQKNR